MIYHGNVSMCLHFPCAISTIAFPYLLVESGLSEGLIDGQDEAIPVKVAKATQSAGVKKMEI